MFNVILSKAAVLCEASYGTLWLCQNDGYRAAAIHGDLSTPFVEQWRNGSIYRPAADVTLAQAMLARKPVQEADLRNKYAVPLGAAASGQRGRDCRYQKSGSGPDAQ